MEQTITFKNDDGEEILFTVICETRLNGANYLLVNENENDEESYILKEVGNDETDMVYEIVEDDGELESLARIFETLLDDVDIEL